MRSGLSVTELVRRSVMVLMCALLSSSAWAQQTASGIAGTVRDTSGAVLPGVTVEAASPVLIEKVRTVVTNGEGRYSIVDLRPGTYVITFTITGFSSVKREGIELTAGFTAAVNADLQVGAVAETITVSGATPLVDTQNVRKQTVMSKDLLDTLPSSTKNLNNVATITPGFASSLAQDVVGGYTTQVGGGAYHGKGGSNVTFDGMGIQHSSGNMGYTPNTALTEEVTLSTSGISAESNADGPVANMVPREGGNTFRGNVSGLFSGNKLQMSNLTDDLRAKGLTTVNEVVRVWDGTFSLGGPIKQDKIWFFASFREWGSERQGAGKFWNLTQGTMFYNPDPDRPATGYEWYESKAARITWQASQKNKLNFLVDRQRNCNCHGNVAATTSVNPPESTLGYHFDPDALYQVTWNSPRTSKLLLEAGVGAAWQSWPAEMQPGVTADDISITEQSTGMTYNAAGTYNAVQDVPRFTQRFSLSYVTGSHNFKTGFQLEESIQNLSTEANHNVNYRFNNRIPNQITQYATPYLRKNRNRDLGIYFQDQWAIRRVTLNYGLRYDYFYGYIPPQHVDATPNGWIPARDFAEVTSTPSWKDVNPRGGVVFDLLGDGKTALKVTMGRYVAKTTTAITSNNNPITTSVNSVTRIWNDTNLNFIPDCNLADRAANNECLAVSNQNFGGLNITTLYDDDVLRGFGVRGYNWDFTTELQHEFTPRLSVSGGYYRNWYGNFTVTKNTLTAPEDYTAYCITAPLDSRLPQGGGYQICNLADVSLAQFGRVFSQVRQASVYGDQTQVNDFFGITANARFASGARISGGLDLGRTVTDNCFIVDSVQDLLNCHNVKGYGANAQVKFNGNVPLPANFVVSGVFQTLPGSTITASYAAPNSAIAPTLGRNLAACGGRTPCTANATVPLVASNILFNPRVARLDLRLAKRLNVSPSKRLMLNFDVFNVLNGSYVLGQNNTFGNTWQKPSQTMDGLMFQLSANLSF
jgi:Carboxypeptidase regulatory-like domain